MPKFVDVARNEADFWYLGCIDATLWWLIAADHLPDYAMAEEPGDIIRFSSRAAVVEEAGPQLPPLSPEALEAARALAPGWDVYALEADWRAYWAARESDR